MKLSKSVASLFLAGASTLTAFSVRLEAETALIDQRIKQARLDFIRGLARDLKSAFGPDPVIQSEFFRDHFPVPEAPRNCKQCPMNPSTPCKHAACAPSANVDDNSPGQGVTLDDLPEGEGIDKNDLEGMYQALAGREFPGFAAMAQAWVEKNPRVPAAS